MPIDPLGEPLDVIAAQIAQLKKSSLEQHIKKDLLEAHKERMAFFWTVLRGFVLSCLVLFVVDFFME